MACGAGESNSSVMPKSSQNHVFYFPQQGGAFYLIPEGIVLPPGELDLRSLRGEKRLVDAAAAAVYAVDRATAHAHLKRSLVAFLQELPEGLKRAWARGRGR